VGKKIRVFETFAGYGGASFGLEKAGVPFDCVGYSEINPYAIQCYDQNHKGIKNYGDISKIVPGNLLDFDLLTGGFPCQDVSMAGKRDLSKGRTMLIEHVFRIIKEKQPKYILLENVKGLLSMTTLWDSIRYTLKNLGYGVAYKVLNSKEHGIPQNRERVWIVCKLGGWDFMEFMFPPKQKLKLTLQDLLQPDNEVDKKYYLTKHQIKYYNKRSEIRGKPLHKRVNRTVATTITSRVFPADCVIIHSKYPRSGDRLKGGTGHLSKSDNTSYCIDRGNSQYVEYDGKHRVLTPTECFRLMGFLDNNINLNGLSDTRKYELAGNGWEINVVSQIFERMFK